MNGVDGLPKKDWFGSPKKDYGLPKWNVSEQLYPLLKPEKVPPTVKNETGALTSHILEGSTKIYYVALVVVVYSLSLMVLIIKFAHRERVTKNLDFDLFYDKYYNHQGNIEKYERTGTLGKYSSCPILGYSENEETTEPHNSFSGSFHQSTNDEIGGFLDIKIISADSDVPITSQHRCKSLPDTFTIDIRDGNMEQGLSDNSSSNSISIEEDDVDILPEEKPPWCVNISFPKKPEWTKNILNNIKWV